jgi:hypothetical protein
MISKYLLSTCLFVIDDFNEQYREIAVQSQELIDIAYGYTEADLVVRIGYPFRQMAKFVLQTSRTKEEGNDIVVESKDFRMEVKYLKTQKSEYDKDSNKSYGWEQIHDDFNWLFSEIKSKKKDRRAFILGWFNSTKSFSNLMPLGVSDRKAKRSGHAWAIDSEKFIFFPFLGYNKKFTDAINYRYDLAFEPQRVNLPEFPAQLNCLFLGKPDDKFHMAIYY